MPQRVLSKRDPYQKEFQKEISKLRRIVNLYVLIFMY